MTCVPSEDSDQHGHPHEEALDLYLLIECTTKTLIRLYDCMQAHLSLCWVHSSFCWVLSCSGSNDTTIILDSFILIQEEMFFMTMYTVNKHTTSAADWFPVYFCLVSIMGGVRIQI